MGFHLDSVLIQLLTCCVTLGELYGLSERQSLLPLHGDKSIQLRVPGA